MKTPCPFHLVTTLALALLVLPASAQQPDPQAQAPKPATPEPARDLQPADPSEPAPIPPPRPATQPLDESEKGIRFNFRGVPLDMILNYLSDAAGFIIIMETKVEGKVDAWSNQPLTKSEAIVLLNTILNQHGYAAIRNDRTLRIVSRDEAKTKDIPVRTGSNPSEIPKSDEMVTQILPVRYANASQLVQNLTPLLATYATLSANESGNALVLTGTQSDVRRMAEIVQALDTSISSISTIRVFALRYADAKALATAVSELFQPPNQSNNDRRREFINRFFNGPGGGDGGRGGNNNRGGTSGGGAGPVATTRVIAVPDERANSLVVSAPDEVMPTIENLVSEMDVSVADITELRVFHLKHADPIEMADLLAGLFPDETAQRANNNLGQPEFRFGGPPRDGGRNRNTQSNVSERLKRMGRVTAVPDQRTSSLVVSAASELMPQISAMIEQLDSSPARKQKVFVYSLENADVQQVEQIVRDMFDRSNTSGNRNALNQNNALINRSQQNQQATPGNAGAGAGGFGNQGGFGGGGQNQIFR